MNDAAHHNISGNRFIVFFRLHFATDTGAKQLSDLLGRLYAAIERAFQATKLNPQILTSPFGSGLLCKNTKDAIVLASLVANDLDTAVTIGLEQGYVVACHTHVLVNDIVVMVSDSINNAARIAFADNETGSILASSLFADSLCRVNRDYANAVGEVKTCRVKRADIKYHVLDKPILRQLSSTAPEPGSPTPKGEIPPPTAETYNDSAHVLLIDIVGFTGLPRERMKPAVQKMWTKIGETAGEFYSSLPPYVGAGDGVAFVDSQGYKLFLLAEQIMRYTLRDDLRLHVALDYGPMGTLTLPGGQSMILGPPIIDADDASHKVEPENIAVTERFLAALHPSHHDDVLSRGTRVGYIHKTVVLQIPQSHNYYTLAQILGQLDKHNAQHVWVFSESLLILHGKVEEQQKMAYAILDRLMTHPNRNYRYVLFADKQTQLTACKKLFEQVKLDNPEFANIDLPTRILFSVIPNACKKSCAAQKLVAATSPHVVLWQDQLSGGQKETRGFGAMTVTSRTESQHSARWIYLESTEAEKLSKWLQTAGLTYI